MMGLQQPIKDKPKLISRVDYVFQSSHVSGGSDAPSSMLCLHPLVSHALTSWPLNTGIIYISFSPLTCLDYPFNSSEIIIQTQMFINNPQSYCCNGHAFCSLYSQSFSKAPINIITSIPRHKN